MQKQLNDDDIFDEHGVMRPGKSLHVPFHMRDSAPRGPRGVTLMDSAPVQSIKDTALAIVGQPFHTYGLGDQELKCAAVRHRLGDAAVAGKPAAEIDVQFATLAAMDGTRARMGFEKANRERSQAWRNR